MTLLLKEIRHNPLLWLLAFVPVVFAVEKLKPEAYTLLFVAPVLMLLMAYLIFAMTLYLLPPRTS